ncbi:Ribosome maturation factor RimP [Galdieria sulphuraria]|nr:Ribosome maturation factor RimP [Galdieria sulphuraria]
MLYGNCRFVELSGKKSKDFAWPFKRFCCCSNLPPNETAESSVSDTSESKRSGEPIFISRARQLAEKAAHDLSLTIENMHWSGGKLVVYISHIDSETSPNLGDCSALSRSLSRLLDEDDVIPFSYQLEVSTPGLSGVLNTDKDFSVFKGFPIRVTTSEEHKGKKEFVGRLAGHSLDAIRVNSAGKMTKIPRALVKQVVLIESSKIL